MQLDCADLYKKITNFLFEKVKTINITDKQSCTTFITDMKVTSNRYSTKEQKSMYYHH